MSDTIRDLGDIRINVTSYQQQRRDSNGDWGDWEDVPSELAALIPSAEAAMTPEAIADREAKRLLDEQKETALAALREQAAMLAGVLHYVVEEVPSDQRDPETRTWLSNLGKQLTLATTGTSDPELRRLREDCVALTAAALNDRIQTMDTSA